MELLEYLNESLPEEYLLEELIVEDEKEPESGLAKIGANVDKGLVGLGKRFGGAFKFILGVAGKVMKIRKKLKIKKNIKAYLKDEEKPDLEKVKKMWVMYFQVEEDYLKKQQTALKNIVVKLKTQDGTESKVASTNKKIKKLQEKIVSNEKALLKKTKSVEKSFDNFLKNKEKEAKTKKDKEDKDQAELKKLRGESFLPSFSDFQIKSL